MCRGVSKVPLDIIQGSYGIMVSITKSQTILVLAGVADGGGGGVTRQDSPPVQRGIGGKDGLAPREANVAYIIGTKAAAHRNSCRMPSDRGRTWLGKRAEH